MSTNTSKTSQHKLQTIADQIYKKKKKKGQKCYQERHPTNRTLK